MKPTHVFTKCEACGGKISFPVRQIVHKCRFCGNMIPNKNDLVSRALYNSSGRVDEIGKVDYNG